MGFGNSEQNFGMIASKFTVAMWYTDRYTLHSKSISLVNEAVVNFNVGLVYCGNIGYL